MCERSECQVDLLGDDVSSPTPQANGQPAQNNQDLLAEIFGSSTPSTAPTSPQPPSTSKSTVQDILDLFGSPNPTVSTPSATLNTSQPPFSLLQTQTSPTTSIAQPTPTPAPSAAPPRLASYTVYEKNELKITLTPQTSAARPGVVNIMARFQVTGSNAASTINFQAAVPKVSCLLPILSPW